MATTTQDVDYDRMILWGMLIVFLVINVPLMLCMPLTADTELYDLQARLVWDGGVLYRDAIEPNLPGIVWLHLGIRALLGSTTVALRFFDLFVVGSICFILSCWTTSLTRKQSLQRDQVQWGLILFLLLTWFYCSTSEWCHCQRDTWMLLPVLCAVLIRRKRLTDNSQVALNRQTGLSAVEGIFWGIAFWIKPFIAIPAILIWGMCLSWERTRKRILINTGGLIAGGLLVGAIGSSWLIATGAWPYFWEMALEWNPAYFESAQQGWSWKRFLHQQERFYPFCLAHLGAIPISISLLYRGMTRHSHRTGTNLNEYILPCLYLGWLVQSFCLQQMFDYIHVPELFLAMAIIVQYCEKQMTKYFSDLNLRFPVRLTFTTLMLILCLTSQATSWQRLCMWPQCWAEGNTPQVQAKLQHFLLPDRNDIQPVIEFLEQQDLQDGELTVHNGNLVCLYRALSIQPSTQFVYLDVHRRIFNNKIEMIDHALNQSGHRFLVTSLIEDGLEFDQLAQLKNCPDSEVIDQLPITMQNQYPYSLPVVFRSGQYLILSTKTNQQLSMRLAEATK